MVYSLHAHRWNVLLGSTPPNADDLRVLKGASFEHYHSGILSSASSSASSITIGTVERFISIAQNYHLLKSTRSGVESVAPPRLQQTVNSSNSENAPSATSGTTVSHIVGGSEGSASPTTPTSQSTTTTGVTATSGAAFQQYSQFSFPVLSQSMFTDTAATSTEPHESRSLEDTSFARTSSVTAAPAVPVNTGSDMRANATDDVEVRMAILSDIANAMRACIVADPMCYPAAIRYVQFLLFLSL
jgi:hypothetical protein